MQKFKFFYLLLMLISLGLLTLPTYAQEDTDTVLAEGVARSFLVTLTTPELLDTLDFYLLDSLKTDPVLAPWQSTFVWAVMLPVRAQVIINFSTVCSPF